MSATRLNPGIRAGLTAADRIRIREELTDWYADHGIDEDRAMLDHSSSACRSGRHDQCMAEVPGGPGCLDESHDADAP